ncbi:MAG: RimK family protein [Alteromonadaceae bacterium]|nr:RimK family protein [Alteromonadaceae bacterium]
MHHTLIVANQPIELESTALTVLTFEQYLADYPKWNEPKTRVINLCDTEQYLSNGYYCSLLAEARQHRVIPSVNTINDLRLAQKSQNAPLLIVKPQEKVVLDAMSDDCYVFFGKTDDSRLKRLASLAFTRFPSPVLKLIARPEQNAVYCQSAGFDAIPVALQQTFVMRLDDYRQQQWRSAGKDKQYRWDMAILTNPDEAMPPSDKKALSRFVKAAGKAGFHAQVVTAATIGDITQYDALFIRETTAIDHNTYRLAREAEREGLVVLDDSQSILRCCNKIYLQDAFSYNKVPAPKARFVTDAKPATCSELIQELQLPIILKLPESSFSKGVFKVESASELKNRLQEMLEASALVLAQEYVFTEFDWRIGMLGGRPIYACKYFMARNHWQIYHHEGDKTDSGDFITMPTFEVPKPVLKAAIAAAGVVGTGLYGVDIKQRGNKVFVIEVNDNPNIDAGIEDKYLGDELYYLIMQEFVSRVERRGRQ